MTGGSTRSKIGAPGTNKLIERPLFQKSNWRFRPVPDIGDFVIQ
jgi:hypothetical protein